MLSILILLEMMMSATAEAHKQDSYQNYRNILCCLKKAEVREIERHKYFMSIERGHEVGFEEAAQDWLDHYAQEWREDRQKKMLAMQRDEINRYKWVQSERARCDLGGTAVLDWIQRYAANWREWYENEYVGE